jgi:hypothetical protein
VHSLVISDNERMSLVIRDVLVNQGYVCEAQDLLGLSSAVKAVPRDADLVSA